MQGIGWQQGTGCPAHTFLAVSALIKSIMIPSVWPAVRNLLPYQMARHVFVCKEGACPIDQWTWFHQHVMISIFGLPLCHLLFDNNSYLQVYWPMPGTYQVYP